MRGEFVRWPLLAAGALLLLAAFAGRATPARVVVGGGCLAAWYALSRRKALSLDRDRRGTPDPRERRRA